MDKQPQKRGRFRFPTPERERKAAAGKAKKQNKTDFVVKQIKITLMTSKIKTPVVLLQLGKTLMFAKQS